MRKKKRGGFVTIPGGNQEHDHDRDVDEQMDKLIMQAVKMFLLSVADQEQRAFIETNWKMAHGIMRQCAACGILAGLEAQVLPNPENPENP